MPQLITPDEIGKDLFVLKISEGDVIEKHVKFTDKKGGIWLEKKSFTVVRRDNDELWAESFRIS